MTSTSCTNIIYTFFTVWLVTVTLTTTCRADSFFSFHIILQQIKEQSCPEAALGGPIALLRNGDIIDIDAKKGTIDVRLSKKELAARKRKWKPRKSDFGSGTLWKYAQTVGPAYLGAPTHPGKKKEVKDYSEI